MPTALLGRHITEPLTVLVRDPLGTGRFGEQTARYVPSGPPVQANVQPLGVEDAVRLSLPATVEYHRAFVRVALAGKPEAVTYRGRTYAVERYERWQSYTVLVLRRA